MTEIFNFVSLIAFFSYVLAKCRREVHMMQQNSYFISRYWKWWNDNRLKAINRTDLLGIVFSAFLLIRPENPFLPLVFAVIYGTGAYLLWTKKEKKALVYTPRAKRLLGVILVLYIVKLAFVSTIYPTYFLHFAPYIALFSFVFLMFSASLLAPVENSINNGFVVDAKKKLKGMPNLKVVGITGSYGKTSVKHFVARILSEKYNVLHTPGSVNTTLGVVRIIREQLRPTHDIFIAEMGAKKMGDVKELCDLVEPDIAILTAIGPEHLDTFGDMKNVQKGNFELPESLDHNGFAILNADYELVKEYDKNNTGKIWYSVLNTNADYSARNIQYTPGGMTFEFLHKGNLLFPLETKLLGDHNVSNIIAACAVASELGVEPGKIAFAVRNLQAVQHRLEVKKFSNGLTIIDDAFNSNPMGAAMAVDVLGKISGNKKIIVTPGMIELGELEFEANKTFGKQIAAVCDFTILVGPKQTAPIQEGLREASYPENKLFIAKNLTEAIAKVNEIATSGDVVLYENDLPDTYDE
ncbi:MAG: Mur ligase family protein [Saprospiraceae bacterium]